MGKTQVILIILSIIGLSSCNKEPNEESIKYPITFTSKSIAKTSLRVFIKNEEITTPLIKEEIISRQKIYLPVLEDMEIDGKIIATYISADTVKLLIDFSTEEETRIVREQSGLIYWESQDTTEFKNSSYFHFSNLLNYVPIYYEEFNVPLTTGYSKATKGKECYYLIRDNKELELPMLDYIFKNEIGAIVVTEVNNDFDEKSIMDLNLNDTIIVREYFIEMK